MVHKEKEDEELGKEGTKGRTHIKEKNGTTHKSDVTSQQLLKSEGYLSSVV